MTRTVAVFLSLLLLAAGALRVGALVLRQPAIGYANQFDMGRTSACFGLWPRIPIPARYEATREAPIGHYILDPTAARPDECYASTELLLTGAAIGVWKAAASLGLADSSSMDLRFVGTVKGGVLVLTVLLLAVALRRHPAGLLTHAVLFAFVLADPVVTLWLNTLYTEFAAVLSFYIAVVALSMIVVLQPERVGWYAAFGLALLALGLSRQQHVLLPAFLFLLALPAMWGPFRRGVGPLAFIAVAVVALQLFAIPRPASITSANNVDVVLGTLLPASSRQQQSLDEMGLPPSCGSVIGATWYVTMGEDLSVRCPDAMTVHRSQVINLLVAEPGVLGTAMARAIPLSQPPLIRYVGVEEGWRFATIEKQFGLNGMSIGTFVERLPPEIYCGIVIFVLIAFPLSLLAWARSIVRDARPSLDATLGSALTGTVAYALLSSVLGDGLVEVPRHAHLGNVSMIALFVLAIAWMVFRAASIDALRAGRRASAVAMPATPWYEWSLLGTAIAVAASSPLWLAIWQAQPLAMGVVDEPETNRVTGPVVLLHGWAMDPFGPVVAYSLVNDRTKIEARPYRHPLDPHGVELARVFPTYRDPSTARFEIPVDIAAYDGQPIAVRTFARNRDGVITEIDRRVLRTR